MNTTTGVAGAVMLLEPPTGTGQVLLAVGEAEIGERGVL